MASNAATTINPEEARHFGTLAADWWNPAGTSAMLHKLNPPRLSYIRGAIDEHWGTDSRNLRPLAGKKALDVGCGAGLLCEPLARLGAQVTGIDAAAENIAAAQDHAEKQGVSIDYQAVGVEVLGRPGEYDLVTSMEVIEHVTDPSLFLRGLVEALAPGGLMILSTPNRTALSKLAMITVGEGMGMIPKGTHEWKQFITPEELTTMLDDAGMEVTNMRGMIFTPGHGFQIGDNKDLNYILSARRKG
ncbi:MAG: bifunctional 2-polyprenyl-6-hydroxyphenol methylase/3-demethylubiquinol 3-O-methyltransferase UbiG [Sphingobium sp.]|nr:bifunctional 2-polyprenyl-6-hydroxyphenol methylase/3-demethylubiquinol 3-O-methyltransferase UbiG [Sphingobium sp.]